MLTHEMLVGRSKFYVGFLCTVLHDLIHESVCRERATSDTFSTMKKKYLVLTLKGLSNND